MVGLVGCSHVDTVQRVVVDRQRIDGWTLMQHVGDQSFVTDVPPIYRLRVNVEGAVQVFTVTEDQWTDARIGTSVSIRRSYVGCLRSEEIP